ncbi:MAG TPA: hypothetical protein VKB79_21535 [Bryobacteraceae bacterium]|nr:hypothetical protein [Bryobacteraceae bacterium]
MTRREAIGLVASAAAAQTGFRDRYFSRYPVDEWAAQSERAQIRWTARVEGVHLSPHQRLTARVEIAVDAREIEKRRGRGEIASLIQIEDAGNERWRVHNSLRLTGIPEEEKARGFSHAQDVFVLPGDYTLTLAVADSHTREHSIVRRKLHVPPLHSDPLPSAWNDLPPVEFVERFGAPDVWFQPYVRGRICLPVATRRPVHIDVVMNMTPSERLGASVHGFRSNMSVLVPALKLLSGLDLSQGSLDVAVLDLARQKTWEQKSARGLDWNKMRLPFAEANPGVIDVQSLAENGRMTQFFWDRILERVVTPSADDPRVVIVLSAPAYLGHQFRVEPASVPKDPNRRVFYLRYRPTPPVRRLMEGELPRPVASSLPEDDLEHTLKALDARMYSAVSPEEFRHALANVMAEVARL